MEYEYNKLQCVPSLCICVILLCDNHFCKILQALKALGDIGYENLSLEGQSGMFPMYFSGARKTE